jgi:uncharacterized iron-regulated membrane protein
MATIGQRRLLIDSRSGQLLGESAPRLRAFFRVVTDWHRWLALTGEQRVIGKAVTGWANLVFAFIVLSGMYLWLPRVWRWRQVRAVLWFRGGLRAKARDFNWHNAIGIWCAVPLFLIVISALPISFPWASNLVYRLAGEAPPPPASRPAAGAERPGRRARSISRFLHTGEVLGLLGQTIAGLASLGGVVLVWTGLALTWRRFRAWRARSQEHESLAA